MVVESILTYIYLIDKPSVICYSWLLKNLNSESTYEIENFIRSI